MDEIRVLSPATVANVVCGFDCLGFALSEPYDEMTVRRTERSGIRLVHHDNFGLSHNPSENVAGVALRALLDAVDDNVGFDIEITKHIKPGSGIGSSAASACGAVVAANHLLGGRFNKSQLVEFAMAGEMLASGSRHADNLAPCIYGGFTLVRSTQPIDIVPLGSPELYATVLHPQVEVRTSEARAMLPKEVPMKEAVRNWSNLGALVAALAQGNHELISRSMEDTIVEPVRKKLVPAFDEVKRAGLDAGALGGGISGSGPSIFMLCRSLGDAEKVERSMREFYTSTGIEFNTYVSAISANGVREV